LKLIVSILGIAVDAIHTSNLKGEIKGAPEFLLRLQVVILT
jgi:hypothetical protein